MTKLTILTVDDCSVMRMMIERTLNMMGLNIGAILEAANGREGINLLEKNSVDLVILDMNMPVMDGMEMLNKLQGKSCLKDTPVLIVSTESNEKRIETIAKMSRGFVHKPFTPEILKNEISKILNDKILQ